MLTGVMALYAGDSMSFQTNITNPVYIVRDNSSSLEGLDITFDNGNITISTALNYKPDNFTLIFFDEITREVEKIIYRGSGGGRSSTKYIETNVTVYVPEYINTTETIEVEIEVEKIVDNIIIEETGYQLWEILMGMILGGLLGWIINAKINKHNIKNIDAPQVLEVEE